MYLSDVVMEVKPSEEKYWFGPPVSILFSS